VRVLVTGGAGFIGSHIVDALVGDGHEVRVLDALFPVAHAGPPDWANDGAEYVSADVTDAAAVRTAVRGIDAVSHQAAMVGLGVEFGDVVDYVHHNDVGTAVLLRALHANGFRGRVVLASSMVVYGEGRYQCASHGVVVPEPRRIADLERGVFDAPCPGCGAPVAPLPVPETTPLDPRNVYAATKVHQEHLCRAFAREHDGVTLTALRYHNVYGPRMPSDTPYAGVASMFRSALARGESPQVFEDGGQLRDFVHVRDVARANVCALRADEPYDGALNVASGTPRSVLQMADALAGAFGRDAPRPVVCGSYRRGDVRHVFASPENAATSIGFRAAIAFAEGMQEFAHTTLRPSARARDASATRPAAAAR
jgi:dTDP-L-rhamnose 4-epimerase